MNNLVPPGGSTKKLTGTMKVHESHCLSIREASYHNSSALIASPVASTRLVANVKPRRLSKSDNYCKNSISAQVDWFTARSPQYSNVIDDYNGVMPTVVSQDLFSVKKIILASERNDRETPIWISQLRPKSSGNLTSKLQENCKDGCADWNLATRAVLEEKLAKPRKKWGGNSVFVKENQVKLPILPKHVLSELVITNEKEPELLAKDLIKVAIGFERRRRMATAFSIFKRAYTILPKKSDKLAERLQRLAEEWPEIVVQVPSQEMPTATYMTKVLERDLMNILNHGSTKELTELFAVGHKRAGERPFVQLDDLERVLGMSPKAVAKIYEHHTNWENHR